MDDFYNYGTRSVSQPVDLNSAMPPVQNFAIGGIANPIQRPVLRGVDRTFLNARQKELDAFEQQRVAYNDALNKWQTDVYNPYKSQVDAYNAAAQKYNTEVYQPYEQQYAAYEKALNEWNAGPRTSDYAGPAAPTLASEFSMAAPTAPKAFEMQAPVLPFKEEDVQKFQQEAASRAQKDARGRAVAIDVVSNPDQFNFGSMSVANRFMAEGGPVDKEDDDGLYDAGAGQLIKDFEGYGYTAEEIQDLVDKVAEAGRGGDELLAYLSPESMEFLKSRGGSGTINPITGLPEFKGGLLGKIVGAVRRAFGRRQEQAAAPAAPTEAAAAAAPAPAASTGPSAADLMKELEKSNAAKVAADAAAIRAQQEAEARMAELRAQQEAAQKAAVEAALRADAEARARMVAAPVIGQQPTAGPAPAPTPAAPISAPRPTPVALDPRLLTSRSGAAADLAAISAPTMATAVEAARPIAPVSLGRPTGSRTTAPGSMPSMTTPAMGAPRQDEGSSPVVGPAMPGPVDYSSLGVGTARQNLAMPNMNAFGAVGTASQNLQPPSSNFFAMTQPAAPGRTPGSISIGSPNAPLYNAAPTFAALAASPNLSPTMLGGVQNAGIMVDRMGNRIYAPGANPLFGFAKGGGIDVAALLAQNAETLAEDEKPEEVTNTDPVGTAQKYLQDLSGAGQSRSPVQQSVKRSKLPASGGAQGVKGMTLDLEALSKGEIGGKAPKARETDSARAQLEELARQYQLKLNAARNKARGLSADTFGAPTLEGPSLTKASLAKKRFAKGGEAKKPEAEESGPSLFGVSSYATRAAERMFPGQMGQDDQRDAARHMLAAAMVARKTNPAVAEFLGKAHERTSNPESFFSMFGIGKPRSDYEMDVHNNRLGAELAARTKSQAELEKLVQTLATQAQNKQVQGKPWTMSREQMEARKVKAEQGMTPPPEYAHGGAVHRAAGSPQEGELSDAEREAASRPAFVTPKSGKGRKRGPVSDAINSGEALTSMAKGATELPYDIAGAPVDIATLLMRPLGYNVERPVMGSDWIKSKMTEAGVRPAPPSDPTQRGFFTAGELLSNLTNPAGVTRAGARGAQKVGQAASDVAKDFQEYNRQLTVPGASYAVRPTGSTMLSGPVGMEQNISKVDQLLQSGVSNARSAAGQNRDQESILQNFWDKKARNYFTRQFGTPDDPIATAISKKQIKGTALDELFPEYLIDQLAVGKTRVNDQGQERFFPKYPRAMQDFTTRYDKATGLKGNLITTDPAAANPKYGSLLSDEGKLQGLLAETAEQDKLLAQGLRPELINTNVGAVTKSAVDEGRIIGDGTDSAKALFNAFEEASKFKQLPEPEKTGWINKIFGEGRRILGKNEEEVGKNLLPENVRTAIEKGEPVYDIQYMGSPLTELFNPASINAYLAGLPAREAANIRFEDAVKGALKMRERAAEMENVVGRIKAGKPVADTVFSKGVSAPLLQIKEGPLEGFAWKRIEKREATVPEGAYVGHSVGGYEMGGATYTADKREGFNTGKWQVYTLRDNRNRPVNTIEVRMVDEDTPVVTQIKGNGRATGNTAPEKYDTAVLEFLQKHLKPAAIEESDSYLTPMLQDYKQQLGPSPRMR